MTIGCLHAEWKFYRIGGAAPNERRKGARLSHSSQISIVEREILHADRKRNRASLTWSQPQTTKSAELLYRTRNASNVIANVELDNFVTRDLPRICDIYVDPYRVSRPHCSRT